MKLLRDLWLEIKIENARRKFVTAYERKKPNSYDLMVKYFHLCNQRKDEQIRRMEGRFM